MGLARQVLPRALLRVGAMGRRMGRTPGSHQPGDAWVYWHHGTDRACWGCVGRAAIVGIPEQVSCMPSPVCNGTTSFPSIQLQEQPLASQCQLRRLALPMHPLGPLGDFLGEPALGSGCRHCLTPRIYTQVPIPCLPYPGFSRCQLLRDAAALCGRLRFIHYFISTRL